MNLESLATATNIDLGVLTQALDPYIQNNKIPYRAVRRLTMEQITELVGLTQADQTQLASTLDAARILYTSGPDLGKNIDSPELVAQVVMDLIGHEEVEKALVLGMDVMNRVIGYHTLSMGTSESCIIRTREVYVYLCSIRASNFVIAHNHPSGSVRPSADDIEITKNFLKSADIMGFSFLDHLIVSDDNYQSIRKHMGYWDV